MPQSLAQIYIHIVFSTKNRKPWLRDSDLRDELYAYMATVLRDNVGSLALIMNGVEDHVHAQVRLSRRFAVMKVAQKSKTETSKWLKRHCSAGDDFAWQAGYGAFSEDEFRELCRRHDLE